MSKSVTIEAIENGCLMSFDAAPFQEFPDRLREAYPTLDEVLARLLSYYEQRWPEPKGRSPEEQAKHYGRVVIEREPSGARE